MRGNKGSVSLDVIAGTCLLLLVVTALAVCVRTGDTITKSNMAINTYESGVITKLTSLESLDALQLYQLNGTVENENDIEYTYSCSQSMYNTIHGEVRAVYKSLNCTFIVETFDTNNMVE